MGKFAHNASVFCSLTYNEKVYGRRDFLWYKKCLSCGPLFWIKKKMIVPCQFVPVLYIFLPSYIFPRRNDYKAGFSTRKADYILGSLLFYSQITPTENLGSQMILIAHNKI